MTSYIQKFNPYGLPEETLGAIATGRERVLEEILGIIASNAEGGRVQHLQVVAPRGYGKSFLMRMVQFALKARVAEGLPAVLALLPEEQHNVDAPHRLLNEIQRVLEGRPADSLLGGAFSEGDRAWEESVTALDAAIAEKLPEGRGVAVAVVENFDQLMQDVFRKPRDQSRLRALLDRQGGRLMLLATATRRADAAYEQRLFHATRVIELEPWQEETCLTFFEKLRGHRRAGEEMSPRLQAKARALAQFIGGSPRMATVLAEVLDNNDSLRVAQMLDALIDELTPYYKHRIESLSRRARTLLDALLRMGEPRTQSEIAARLGTVQARIAEPFNELRAGGEVMGVKARHSAEMLYRVSDRLMAHYYRKRYLGDGEGASKLESIVEFLESFYSPEEKRTEAERLRALGRSTDAAVLDRLGVSRALRATVRPGPVATYGWLDELEERLIPLCMEGRSHEAVTLCQQAVKRSEASGNRREHARSQRLLSWMLEMTGQQAEAEETLRRALALAEQIGDLSEQADSSCQLGWMLRMMGRHTEAQETLRRALVLAERVGDGSEIVSTGLDLLRAALASGDDATVVMVWHRVNVAAASAPAKSGLPDINSFFHYAAVAALRTEQFGTFWYADVALPIPEWELSYAQSQLADAIAAASQSQGRTAAYALAAQGIEVLTQDALGRGTRGGRSGPEPIAFLRGLLSRLVRPLSDPALIRDIAALLEHRLLSKARAEREILEAAARHAENPDDPAALERIDPDIAKLLERMRGAASKPGLRAASHQGKRSGSFRRKK